MKITIDTEILQRSNLSLGEFLVMLFGYCSVKYKENFDKLIEKGIINKDLFDKDSMILSNNTKNFITSILLKSDNRIKESTIDFTELAKKLQDIFPQGCRSGTTYSWRDKTETIAQKLRALVVIHHFSFTEEEALKATKEYVDSFSEDKEKMQLLKYFILKTHSDRSIDSMFMTIIENNR